ncbi:hypothetical protein [Nannocystis bainbridge]|uniref:Integral membrane protein n=1 Tax=Nannocystis bainbridge TaxID=2995303 RepID=A0ABT5E5B6_9BACT|nr:hypothetical protein [Nannocystis bainbridge]MDC0721061.1 hypothetical protein [Nannocystis bainbridge]
MMPRRARAILWLDGSAACIAGLVVLALRGPLAQLHAFSPALVGFIGAVNLAYACYSGSLAVRASRGRTPSRRAIDLLVAANAAWVVACAAILATTAGTASIFGVVHVGFEALFVGSLAVVEFREVRPFAREPGVAA